MSIKAKRKIKVGLVQIGDKFGDQYYLPYAIGVLQAYAQKKLQRPEDFGFFLPIFKRIKISEAVASLSGADIIYFSAYIWNYQISLEIAKQLKNVNPDCVIVFGGPQVPEIKDDMQSFLKNNSFIDIGCYGEGEHSFVKILENLPEKTWEHVPSAGFMSKSGQIVFNPAAAMVVNLDEIPSPYLDGVFDLLIDNNPNEGWSALLETNRGCPYSCAYCYWGTKGKNKIRQYSLKRVFQEIDWFSKRKIQFVFCCDGNFGILKRDLDIVRKVAANKKEYGYPEAFSVQNTKNSTEKIFAMQKILNDAQLQKGVNLALQSLNDETLKSINRNNISTHVYKDLQHMFAQAKIPTFSDLIIGLPGESYDSFVAGVSKVIGSGQHNRIQFINLMMLENTQMSVPAYRNKYGIETVDSRIIPHHTSLDREVEVFELQKLVVATNQMSRSDWMKTRVFCWMVALLYFNKLLQIPIMLLNKLYAIPFNELMESFLNRASSQGKFSEIISFFAERAEEIQRGGCEHVAAKEWLNIWWPADEYLFIKLCVDGGLDQFYAEAGEILKHLLEAKRLGLPPKLLDDSIELNKKLLKLPFVQDDLEISLDYNIFDVYQGVLTGSQVPLQKEKSTCLVDRTSEAWSSWAEWCKEVVWYGTKKGAYFYTCRPVRNMVKSEA